MIAFSINKIVEITAFEGGKNMFVNVWKDTDYCVS